MTSTDAPDRARALVSPEALDALLRERPDLLVVDVRWALAGPERAAYEAAHVPGAVFCDLDAELAAPPGDGGRHPLPDPDALLGTLRRLGVSPGRTVVAYDGGHGAAAARLWWVLRWVGHDDVRVLDGGFAAWCEVGLPVESGWVEPTAADDAVVHPGAMPTVTADDVLAGRAGLVVDARTPERFRGEAEPVDPVAGHIPGAVSLPVADVQADGGRYRPAGELAGVFAAVGAGGATGAAGAGTGGGINHRADDRVDDSPGDGDDDDAARPALTASCGSGVTAAQLVLAAHEAGVPVALYPGSWSGWIRDPSRPVATGA
ncbi:sulfurtransferase [Cellulomonas carbonis]|nr:sulfurtransferase [Cellulomonas carbonis]GGC07860.1 sulfurtransferase [Cellulomonas carbonis]